jgi:hypothetical protein
MFDVGYFPSKHAARMNERRSLSTGEFNRSTQHLISEGKRWSYKADKIEVS